MSEDNGMVTVAVYSNETGAIKQVVRCLRQDMHLQHRAWENHDYVEVPEGTDPRTKQINVKTLEVEDKDLAEHRALERLTAERYRKADKITEGFLSSALGGTMRYGSSQVDQLNMLITAQVGGLLMCGSPYVAEPVWSLQYHTAEQGRRLLEDFVMHRDNARRLLS